MNSATRALPFSPTLVRLFFVAAIACSLFVFAIPRAQAAGLTEVQIQAVLGLLTSFNVDQATIANANLALHGIVQPGSAGVTQAADSTSGATFTVSPASGAAPLTVTFTLSHPSSDPGTFSLDFGDGQSIGQDGFSSNCSNTNCTLAVKHVYNALGSYTFKLFYQPPMPACPAGLSCTQVMPAAQTISTATITVVSPTEVTQAVTPNVTPTVIPVVIPATTPTIPPPPGTTPPTPGTATTTTTNPIVITPTVTPTVTPTAAPTFAASPTSGTAPLNVVFTTNVSGSTVVFGDGTSAAVVANCLTGLDGTRNCNTGSYLTTHTYTAPGTYTATLNRTTQNSCPSISGAACASWVSSTEILGTVTITVTGANATAALFAWPASGTAPLTSYLTMTGPQSTSGYSVEFGDGSSGSSWQADVEAPATYFMSHMFSTAGTYTAKLIYQPPMPACPPGLSCAQVLPPSQIVATVTITVGTQSTGSGQILQNFDYAGMMAAVIAAPFSILIDSLTGLFVYAGIGQ